MQYYQPQMQMPMYQQPMMPQPAYGGYGMMTPGPPTGYAMPFQQPYTPYGPPGTPYGMPPGQEYRWCLTCKEEKDRLDDRRESGGRSQRALLSRDQPDTEIIYDWSAFHAQHMNLDRFPEIEEEKEPGCCIIS